MKILISKIKIGKRVRTDLGNLEALAASIQSVGLLHPIVLDQNNNLIAGYRRLKAHELLGLKEIPFTLASSLNRAIGFLKAERDENTHRKPYTPLEALALAEKFEQLEPKRKGRPWKVKPSNNSTSTESHGNLPCITSQHESQQPLEEKQEVEEGLGDFVDQPHPRIEKLRELVNELAGIDTSSPDDVTVAVGYSRRTLTKTKFVKRMAKEKPDKYKTVMETMDKTGNVNYAYETVVRAERKAKLTDEDRTYDWHWRLSEYLRELKQMDTALLLRIVPHWSSRKTERNLKCLVGLQDECVRTIKILREALNEKNRPRPRRIK